MCGLPTIREYRSAAVALLLAGALAAGTALAQPREAPIDIEADRAEVSQRSGKSVYSGDVVLTQSAMTLRGDELTVNRADDGRIRAELVGDPARLERAPEGDERVTGRALRVIYRSDEQTVELVGEAVVERGGDTVRGQTIRHHLASGRTEASRGDGERVRITIEPESDDGAEGENGQ